MSLWLAVLESADETWADDPIGANSREQAIELALKEWGHLKLEEGERIALYDCRYVREIKSGDNVVNQED